MLIHTTNESKRFIISPKKSMPNANTLRARSAVNKNVNAVLISEYGDRSVFTKPFIESMTVLAMTITSIKLS